MKVRVDGEELTALRSMRDNISRSFLTTQMYIAAAQYLLENPEEISREDVEAFRDFTVQMGRVTGSVIIPNEVMISRFREWVKTFEPLVKREEIEK